MRESGEAVVESLGVKPGLKVLDLGCGDGTRRDPSGTLDPRAIAAAGQDPITGCGPGAHPPALLPVFAVVQVPNLARGRCRCSVGEHLPEDHRKASRGEGRVAQYSCSFRLLPPAFAHRPRHRTLEVGGSTPLGSTHDSAGVVLSQLSHARPEQVTLRVLCGFQRRGASRWQQTRPDGRSLSRPLGASHRCR
jgi:hypothetical protein